MEERRKSKEEQQAEALENMNYNTEESNEYIDAMGDKLNVIEKTDNDFSSKVKVDYIPHSANKRQYAEEEGYIRVHKKDMPGGDFYEDDLYFDIRPATVTEIKNFSTINEEDGAEATARLDEILSKCVKVYYWRTITDVDGDEKEVTKPASYRKINVIDRFYLLFLIREITFENKKAYKIPYEHGDCGHEGEAILKPQNLYYVRFEDLSNNIKEFFDSEKKRFVFHTKFRDEPYEFAPHTIGLEADLISYLRKEATKRRNKATRTENNNMPDNLISAHEFSFMKNKLYMFPGITGMKEDEIKRRIKKYRKEGDDSDINSIEELEFIKMVTDEISKLGLKGMKIICENCGEEIHIENLFPKGLSALFLDVVNEDEGSGNPFDRFVR